MDNASIHLAQNLKTLMDNRKMTLQMLSKKSGVAVSTIAEWRQGRQPRDLMKLKKISIVLDVSLDELLFKKL